MQRDATGWIVSGIVVVGLVLLYMWGSYSDLTERRLAYLYHPETDQVYRLELAPFLSVNQKWDPFIPFKDLHYSEPVRVDYLGYLQELMREVREDRRLAEEDFDAWMEKMDEELEEDINKYGDGASILENWDVEYGVLEVEFPAERLPKFLKIFMAKHNVGHPNVFAVDAVVVKSKYDLDGSRQDLRPSFSILHDALLIKGVAAYQIYKNAL